MNILILFSGTKSFSKVFEKNPKNKIRTLDIDNKFKSTYNVDILKWDYKNALKDFKVDYIHSSPICKYFSYLKNTYKNRKENLPKGFILIDKSIEIINWIKKNQNPKLKFTIENPKTTATLKYEPLIQYKHCITSYCQYGFLYQKHTTFWYGGFDLILKSHCNKKNICYSKGLVNGKSHKVRIGLHKKDPNKKRHEDQILDWMYLKELKKEGIYKKYTETEFRYRIPSKLIEDIERCLI